MLGRATLALLVLLGAGGATALSAQMTGQEGPRLLVGAEGAASVDNVRGVRVGRDLHTFGMRLTLQRRDAMSPWVDVMRFRRPELICLASLPCNDGGYLVRAGAAVGVSGAAQSSVVGFGLRGGLGAAFSETTTFAYLVGLGAQWHVHARAAPFVEVRWEHTTGINLLMVGLGLRLRL